MRIKCITGAFAADPIAQAMVSATGYALRTAPQTRRLPSHGWRRLSGILLCGVLQTICRRMRPCFVLAVARRGS